MRTAALGSPTAMRMITRTLWRVGARQEAAEVAGGAGLAGRGGGDSGGGSSLESTMCPETGMDACGRSWPHGLKRGRALLSDLGLAVTAATAVAACCSAGGATTAASAVALAPAVLPRVSALLLPRCSRHLPLFSRPQPWPVSLTITAPPRCVCPQVPLTERNSETSSAGKGVQPTVNADETPAAPPLMDTHVPPELCE